MTDPTLSKDGTHMNTREDVLDLSRRWAEAERDGDADALDGLSTPDFTMVGPLGFVLPKDAWLDRYRSGQFKITALTWGEVVVRDYGQAAVAIGVYDQQAEYQGIQADGKFRVTLIAVRPAGEWLLAGLHLSPITAPGRQS